MANTFTGRKWVLDTVVSTTSVTTDQVVVSHIVFQSMNAAGHQARIADSNGQPTAGFWTAIANGQNVTIQTDLWHLAREKRTLNGLRVMSLTSGHVELWIE